MCRDIDDIASVIGEIDKRIAVIEAIQRIYNDKSTDELHTLHLLALNARWLFGAQYDSPMFVSNSAPTTVVKSLFRNEDYDLDTINNPRRRPDIICLKKYSMKIYTQEFKEAVVKYYERNHTIAETLAEFHIAESSLFAWKKQYDEQHDLIIDGSFKYQNFHQSQDHLRKAEYILEVLRKASCGANASIDDKMAAISKLEGQYSIHVLCEAYDTPEELQTVVEEYIHFYNEERPHRKINMKTPLQIETEFILRTKNEKSQL